MTKVSITGYLSEAADQSVNTIRSSLSRLTTAVVMLCCVLLFANAAHAKNQIRPSVLPAVLDIQQALSPEATEENPSPKINIKQTDTLIKKFLARDLTDYEKALGHQFEATLALETNDYQRAYDAFHQAWLLKVYEPFQQLQIQRTLAQLAMQLGQWQTAVDFYVPWIEAINAGEFETQVSAQDYVYVAQSNYRLDAWPETVRYVNKAIRTSQSPIPESWYRMKLIALLNQYERLNQKDTNMLSKSKETLRHQAIEVSKILVVQYLKTTYWRQLALLYQQGQQDQDYRKALSTLHSAYVVDMLTAEQDLLWMIKLMIQQENYHSAGRVIQTELKHQRLSEHAETLSLQADAWLMAKAFEEAEPVLEQLLSLEPTDTTRKEQLQSVRKLLSQKAKAKAS